MKRLLLFSANQPRYNDTLFRTIISIPTAAYMMLYREKDSFWVAIFEPQFWIGFLFSFAISVLLLWLINRISIHLDRKYNWRNQTLIRIALQFCWGMSACVLLTFLLVTLFFFSFFELDIRDTDYLTHDFPLVILLILLGNLYYMSYYLWLVPPNGFVPLAYVQEVIQDYKQELSEQSEPEKNREFFFANTTEGVLPIPQEHIAIIFRQKEYIILRTFDKQVLTIEQSINKAYSELESYQFFKINPRCIINYKLCKKISRGKFGIRFLELHAPVNSIEEVTRSRVKQFEEWMKR